MSTQLPTIEAVQDIDFEREKEFNSVTQRVGFEYTGAAFDVFFNVVSVGALAVLDGAVPFSVALQVLLVVFFTMANHGLRAIAPEQVKDSYVGSFTLDAISFGSIFVAPSCITSPTGGESVLRKFCCFLGAKMGEELNVLTMECFEVKKGTTKYFVGRLAARLLGGAVATWSFDLCANTLNGRLLTLPKTGDEFKFETGSPLKNSSHEQPIPQENLRTIRQATEEATTDLPTIDVDTVVECVKPEEHTFNTGESIYYFNATNINLGSLKNITFEVDTNMLCKMTIYARHIPINICATTSEAYMWANDNCVEIVQCSNGKTGIFQKCFLYEMGKGGPSCFQPHGVTLTYHLLELHEQSFHNIPLCRVQQSATSSTPTPSSTQNYTMLANLLSSTQQIDISEDITAYASSDYMYLHLSSTDVMDDIINTLLSSELVTKITSGDSSYTRPSSSPSPSPNPKDCTKIFIIVGGIVFTLVVTGCTVSGILYMLRRLHRKNVNDRRVLEDVELTVLDLSGDSTITKQNPLYDEEQFIQDNSEYPKHNEPVDTAQFEKSVPQLTNPPFVADDAYEMESDIDFLVKAIQRKEREALEAEHTSTLSTTPQQAESLPNENQTAGSGDSASTHGDNSLSAEEPQTTDLDDDAYDQVSLDDKKQLIPADA
ncbi:hypothetical protein [Parashewanella tropica]|uniref:hypothetical protein n=1 Tax=Parashewanella tropica TaxID=2547970 RepID=UPI001059ABB1|nr:hypothetical protein [Parashewanella tropica]